MSILDRINAKKISNTILNEKINIVEDVTGRKVFSDFNYKTGKLIGLMMAVQFSGKHRDSLLPAINIEEEELEVFTEIIGGLTYINSDGQMVKGKEQDSNALKEFILYMSGKWSLGYSDRDIDDISEERFKEMQEFAKLKAEKTLEMYSANVDYEE